MRLFSAEYKNWFLFCSVINAHFKTGTMHTTPFNIYYEYDEGLYLAEIRPCCRENNVVDYAVWEADELAFTMTRPAGTSKWVIALKNADDQFDDEHVQAIGAAIEQKLAEQTH
jgi:hypothetical protein